MARAWGNLNAARDLRALVRLDDLRASNAGISRVDAIVMLTHDLNLRFVLTELLPGYLVDPSAVPAGLGPGHRSYRGPMLDLPDSVIVHAPEASVDCATPWRPPSLHLAAYRGQRRLHAKITAVLYELDDDEQWLRLIISSANLTRRAYATNLEVAAYHDYCIAERNTYPSLVGLRGLLEYLAEGSTLGESRAYAAVVERLPQRSRAGLHDPLQLLHSVEPEGFGRGLADWLTSAPDSASSCERTLIVSPFFPVKGDKLRRYVSDQLRVAADETIDLVLDGRQSGAEVELAGQEPFSSPPAWLAAMRGPDSVTVRPTLISRKRDDGSAKGTGAPGRPLHAKLLGTGWDWARARYPRLIWRLAVGSANFTEGGLGLLGSRSNIEAMARLELHEAQDEHDRLLAERDSVATALTVPFALAQPPSDRRGPNLDDEFERHVRAKQVLAALDRAKFEVRRSDQGFVIRVELCEALGEGARLCLGHGGPEFTPDGGAWSLTTDSLQPLFISVEIAEHRYAWPIPASDREVRAELLSQAAGRRRLDRLLDYWLASTTSLAEPDDEDLEIEGALPGAGPDSEDPSVGSWRLNRLALGLRRRLAQAGQNGAPPLPKPKALLGSIRVIELFELAKTLPEPDLAYFGTLVRAALLGYGARDRRHKQRKSWAQASTTLAMDWEQEDGWSELTLAWTRACKQLPRRVRDALDVAAEAVYVSVRDGEVVA